METCRCIVQMVFLFQKNIFFVESCHRQKSFQLREYSLLADWAIRHHEYSHGDPISFAFYTATFTFLQIPLTTGKLYAKICSLLIIELIIPENKVTTQFHVLLHVNLPPIHGNAGLNSIKIMLTEMTGLIFFFIKCEQNRTSNISFLYLRSA